MKRWMQLMQVMVVLSLLLAACGQTPTPAPTATSAPQPTATAAPQPTATEAPAEDVLYLNLVWHQHQPLYYKNSDGIITRPWVRVHATKDYYDMASILLNYPGVQATINMTPVLLRQLDDYAVNGAKDLYWVAAEKPANSLSDDDKRFILQRFFDVNPKIIARFPRLKELQDLRGGSDAKAIDAAMSAYTEQDFRDLQILFNLAWFDPDFLAQEPLKALVDQGKGFSEEDKKTLFDETLKVIRGIVPLLKEMQDKGQIEVITTPYAHPILPLLVDSSLQRVGNPGSDLPDKFSWPQDAKAHLDRSVQLYEKNFGQAPRGLWPGEGSVAQAVVPFIINAGYQWMATGEPVLAQSLGLGSFTRDGQETVQQADDLYRPYYVMNKNGDKLAVFFRDGVISDKIGFTYSGVSGQAAAKDLMQRLENIRAELKKEGAKGPHIVSIILDGENAWENYENDGKDFFNSFYRSLQDSKTVKSITPSEYLTLFPEQREIKDLFPGAWFSPNYDTWIGEEEENTAWNYLGKTRAILDKYERGVRQTTPEKLAEAQDYMYLAEGSDWFWWYGSDQDSGQDSYFDQGFRALLRKVYETLGEPVPEYVDIPIIQARVVAAATALDGLSSPVINGVGGPDEWAKAASYPAEGQSPATDLAYTLDQKNLYFRMTFGESLTAVQRVGFYFSRGSGGAAGGFSRAAEGESKVLLGMNAGVLVEWDGKSTLTQYTPSEAGWTVTKEAVGQSAASGATREFAIPLELFGELNAGDEIRFVTVVSPANQVLPSGGLGQIILPDLGTSTAVLTVEDPEGDDFGPGTYTYPTDGVFAPKSYDLKSFTVAYDNTNLIFRFAFYGPLPNPWGSPSGLAIQTLDIYIDKDPGKGTGARLLLPGRNAALKAGDGWDYALWAEGWTPQVLAPDANGAPKEVTGTSFKIIVDAAARTVTLRLPKDALGDGDPAAWGYAAMVMGQEGYPSTGVWRIRDVEEKNAQWRFGGAPADKNHTRVIDMIWPADGTPDQKTMLGTYTGSTDDPAGLGPDSFAQIELMKK